MHVDFANDAMRRAGEGGRRQLKVDSSRAKGREVSDSSHGTSATNTERPSCSGRVMPRWSERQLQAGRWVSWVHGRITESR